ncbi:MAG: Gfo/Idh/MocA family oxidoreductase [Chloroflexota bacterium]|nr:Gfo/Idh/MocA family oxidoreductase [Chloroflexota bacterium]MDE2921075.1 Gfo/Idh/MocA family oxidoreductase [Chloroflexota bacterium]
MSNGSLGIGIVGAGDIVRTRHMPNLADVDDIAFVAVTNRRRETAEAFAADHSVPNVVDDWRAVVEHPDVDIVWIGATPYMHARVSVAALDAGKHVFCQARMARNLAEARDMLDASERNPGLVAAVCPPGIGVAGDRTMLRLLKIDRFIGALRQVRMSSFGDTAVVNDLLHWRQDFDVSGYNVMNVGIMVEALQRWVGPERNVQAMTPVHIKERRNPETNALEPVRVPDSFTAMGELVSGADYVYQWSGLAHHEPATEVWLYGDQGTLVYDFDHDTIAGATSDDDELSPIEIPADEHYDPNVETDFIDAIRSGSHDTGLAPSFARAFKYMEFMEAATRSARDGLRISLPLD